MCTAISYNSNGHFFGRNLDIEYSYKEVVAITPRAYPFMFRKTKEMKHHYAIIGVAYVVDDYPLYYDGTNEKGLSMAGLLFSGNAYYEPEQVSVNVEKVQIAPFELISWILSQCATVKEARKLLKRTCVVNISFNEELKVTPLHWMLADDKECIVIEALMEGLKIYDNQVGVLTNNPPFDYQMMNLNQYMGLTNQEGENRLSEEIELQRYSRGMGAIGLPGDLSSTSRFVRAVFHKMHAKSGVSVMDGVNQFFHLLGSVEMPRGSMELAEGVYEITAYSSCCDTTNGIYYYTTYDNRQIIGVDMHKEDLEQDSIISYPLNKCMKVAIANG